jgi:hypothetical protein
VFADGKLVGCVGSKIAKLDEDLRRITGQALVDARFRSANAQTAAHVAVTVSILTNPVALGANTPADIARFIRHGEDAVTVFRAPRAGLLLPFVALQQSYSREQFIAAVIDKAGITQPPYQWGTFACTTWLADGAPPQKLAWHLPARTPPVDLADGIARLAPLYLGYLCAHTRPDGLRDGGYRPLTDTLLPEAMAARQIHGGWALALAAAQRRDDDTKHAARTSQATCRRALPSPGLVEDAFLLLTAVALGEITDIERATAARLWSSIDAHGRIRWERAAQNSAEDSRQDYEPPQVLLALAHATAAGATAIDRAALDRALRACKHRFRGRRRWGQVSWLPLALAAWHRVTGDGSLAQDAFEIVDWALQHQQTKSGGFINAEHPDGPDYSTAVYLEGLAAALELAIAVNDTARIARYREAAFAAVRFLDVLTYQERDRSMLPNAARAIGGLRFGLVAGDVRTDFVQHALVALTMLAPLVG